MRYGKTVYGRFIKRVNRFIAEVLIDGKKEPVHIKNTGRLKELLLPDAEVLLEKSSNPNRKTAYSLVAVKKGDRWVNIDSLAPNTVVYEALHAGKLTEFPKLDVLKKEVTYGSSRMDIYWESGEDRGLIEIKGVTLEQEGVAMFPDAPTKRGTKHVMELASACQNGYHAAIFFVIQMKGCHLFTPHKHMDPPFAEAVLQAHKNGVQVLAYDTIVSGNRLELDLPVPVRL